MNAVHNHCLGTTASHEKGVSYIIRKNGSLYEAVNGSTGIVEYSSANAVTVLNAVGALSNITICGVPNNTITVSIGNALTVTGDNVLVQNLILVGAKNDSSIGVLSTGINTIIEKCVITDFKDCIQFRNSGGIARYNTIIQTDKIGSTGNMNGIYVNDTSYSQVLFNKITLPTVTDDAPASYGIYVGNTEALCLNTQVIGNTILNGWDSIAFFGAYPICKENICIGAYEWGIGVTSGELTDETATSQQGIIEGNYLKDCQKMGIVSLYKPHHLTIANNVLINCGYQSPYGEGAITVESTVYTVEALVSISGNIIQGGGLGGGIYLRSWDWEYSTLEGISVIGNQVSGCLGAGFYSVGAKNFVVIGNSFYNNTGYGLQLDGSGLHTCQVAYNIFSGNTAGAVAVAGTGYSFAGNIGYTP
jgi:parallel beta-helix repeat protein